MPNRINQLIYKELSQKYADAPAMILIGNQGISAKDALEMRQTIQAENCRIQNVRNRIADLVFREELGIKGLQDILEGPTLIIDGDEPATVAKLALKIVKKAPKLNVLGAIVESKVLPADQVKALSTMPTRLELIGMISSQATSPFRKVSAQATAPFANVSSQLKSIAEDKAEPTES